jgi:predicted RNase H-like HicB family nuclease
MARGALRTGRKWVLRVRMQTRALQNGISTKRGETKMATVTMIYWKDGDFFLGKILEHPEIMTQGETLEELEENIRDAYRLLVMEDVPEEYETKEIAV